MPFKTRNKWKRPFYWPPATWEFTPGLQVAADAALALLLLLILVTIGSAIVLWPLLLIRIFEHVASGTADDVRNTLLAVAALIGVPFLVWRTLLAAKQTAINRESHYTALFTKAVEQLGSDKVIKRRDFRPEYRRNEKGEYVLDASKNRVPLLNANGEPEGDFVTYETTEKNYEVRLGAIYALERIAQDSERDAWPIHQTLCAYIENNARPKIELAQHKVSRSNHSDIAEIFNVLSRYVGPREQDIPVFFDGRHFEEIWLRGGNSERYLFKGCSFVSLAASKRLSDVEFVECELTDTILYDGEFSATSFNVCCMKNFTIRKAKISGMVIEKPRISEGFIVSQSEISESKISLSQTTLQIEASTIKGCRFTDLEQNMFSAMRNSHIAGSTFQGCTFVECDFSLVHFDGNTFVDCVFQRCNLVGTGVQKVSGVNLQRCMTDSDLNIRDGEDPYQQMRMQWLRWKQIRPLILEADSHP